MEIIIRGENPEERGTSEQILRSAYGREEEVRLMAALRGAAGFDPQLSIVAANGEEILGYALYSRVTVTGNAVVPGAALAVMGVREERRRMGVAERLVRHGLERCRGRGVELVFASAKPEYMAKIGFQLAVPLGLTPDWPAPQEQFTVFDLSGSRLGKVSGTVNYPAAFKS